MYGKWAWRICRSGLVSFWNWECIWVLARLYIRLKSTKIHHDVNLDNAGGDLLSRRSRTAFLVYLNSYKSIYLHFKQVLYIMRIWKQNDKKLPVCLKIYSIDLYNPTKLSKIDQYIQRWGFSFCILFNKLLKKIILISLRYKQWWWTYNWWMSLGNYETTKRNDNLYKFQDIFKIGKITIE